MHMGNEGYEVYKVIIIIVITQLQLIFMAKQKCQEFPIMSRLWNGKDTGFLWNVSASYCVDKNNAIPHTRMMNEVHNPICVTVTTSPLHKPRKVKLAPRQSKKYPSLKGSVTPTSIFNWKQSKDTDCKL